MLPSTKVGVVLHAVVPPKVGRILPILRTGEQGHKKSEGNTQRHATRLVGRARDSVRGREVCSNIMRTVSRGEETGGLGKTDATTRKQRDTGTTSNLSRHACAPVPAKRVAGCRFAAGFARAFTTSLKIHHSPYAKAGQRTVGEPANQAQTCKQITL